MPAVVAVSDARTTRIVNIGDPSGPGSTAIRSESFPSTTLRSASNSGLPVIEVGEAVAAAVVVVGLEEGVGIAVDVEGDVVRV